MKLKEGNIYLLNETEIYYIGKDYDNRFLFLKKLLWEGVL